MLILKMIMIASNSIYAINASIPNPFTRPVIVAAIKQSRKEMATKSRSFNEYEAIMRKKIMKIIIKRGRSMRVKYNRFYLIN